MLAPAIIVVTLLIAGVVFLRFGLVGRRLDDHPVCRKCRFDLVGVYEPGSEGGKCPECGLELSPKLVRRGNRRKRKGAIVAGAFLLVVALGLGGAFGWGAASGFNWNTIKPAWLLQREAASDNAAMATAALEELVSRLEDEELEATRVRELVAIGLDRQADMGRAWEPLWGDLIEAAYYQEAADASDWARYLRQAMPDESLTLSVRELVREGDPIPCRLSIGPARVGTQSMLWLGLGVDRAGFGDDVRELSVGEARIGLGGGGSGGSSSMSVRLELPVGKHDIWVEWRVNPGVQGGGGDVEGAARSVRFERTVEVVPKGAPIIELFEDPELADEVAACVTIQRLSVRPGLDGGLQAGGSLLFKDPPVDLAFDVIWVAGGEEFPAGRAMITAGKKSHGYGIGEPIEGFSARRVDVILRPSIDAAVQSPEIGRIWNGEILIKNVAVEWADSR